MSKLKVPAEVSETGLNIFHFTSHPYLPITRRRQSLFASKNVFSAGDHVWQRQSYHGSHLFQTRGGYGRLKLLHHHYSNQGLNLLSESNEGLYNSKALSTISTPVSFLGINDSNSFISTNELSKSFSNTAKDFIIQHKDTLSDDEANKKYENRIFVGNLSFRVTSHELRGIFEKYGQIVNVAIINDRYGLSKGYGLVTFQNTKDVTYLMQNFRNDIYLDGRQLRLQMAEERTVDEKRYKS